MKKILNIWDLFETNEDYPQDVAERGVPENTLYSYISSTFLDGVINYVKPIKAVMIERYDNNDNTEVVAEFNKEHHSKLAALPDDVLIAAQTKNDYWFFWYDKDCSDCFIGRFNKGVCSEEEFIGHLNTLAGRMDGVLFGRSYELALSGWITG